MLGTALFRIAPLKQVFYRKTRENDAFKAPTSDLRLKVEH
jgi:hypothetical protein